MIAYLAYGSKGRTVDAARVLKRAVTLADQRRRRSPVAEPEFPNFVYHDAAFHAAAYAGDLDFAVRAIATSGNSQQDKTGFHLAMAAIWIRLANRPEALASFERARKNHAFWQEPGGKSPYDYYLSDIEQVFENGDLQSLSKQGIGPEFFVGLERPTFGRVPVQSRFVQRCFQCAVLIPMILLIIGARSAESSTAGTENFELYFALPAFTIAAIWFMLQPHASSFAEFTSEGIVFRRNMTTLWVPWAFVKRLTWDRTGRRIRSIELDRERAKQEGRKARVPKSVALSLYTETWPDSSPDVALWVKAPHLFSGATRIEDPDRAA